MANRRNFNLRRKPRLIAAVFYLKCESLFYFESDSYIICLRFLNLFPDLEPGMFVKGVSSRSYVMRTKLMSDRLLKERHDVRRLQNASLYAKLRHSLNNCRNHNLINSLNSGNCCSIFYLSVL